jgi:hypothetical protein
MTDSLISEDQATAPDSTEAASADLPSQDRPEWLPEKYKTGEDLAKAYKELETKLGAKDTDLRQKIIEELQAEAYSDRPESAGDYQLPEIVDESMAVDNELLQWWAEHSFENGYSQEEFQKGIEMYAQAISGTQPDLEAEAKRLGDNANDRINAASAFANKFFPQEALPAIERMCESADGIIALEVIMDALKDGSFSSDSTPAGRLDEGKLQEMMRDERYWKTRDPHFIKEVSEGFKRLYG